MQNKYFIITIDTEGDNLWNPYQTLNGNRTIYTKNAEYLKRFQILCEKYYFIPTYLTDYEMAMDDNFCKMAYTGLKKKSLEVGMHMHAWNCPPIQDLPYNPKGHNAYAGDYCEDILRSKMHYLTNLLTEKFQTPITSHRGGRWYLNTDIVKMLCELGYTVDCTVTPEINWENTMGNKIGGCNYSGFPKGVYELDADTMKQGTSGLLEIPPTIIESPPIKLRMTLDPKEIITTLKRKERWMRPNGHNLYDLCFIVEQKSKKSEYIEFMIHSSELMQGGSPNFKTQNSINRLYRHMDILFQKLRDEGYIGISLSDFGDKYKEKKLKESLHSGTN